ncbi:MAG: LrgB family protein [Pseudomonadales bacterium]|jgi:putative effector of murein hydrolase
MASWFLAGATILTLVACYQLSLWAYRRSGAMPLLHPVFSLSAMVFAVLILTPLSYGQFMVGGEYLLRCLELAIVALALPIYRSVRQLASGFARLAAGLAVCSVLLGMLAVGPLPWIGVDETVWLSLAPKSVTTPVAYTLAEMMGALAPISALSVSLTGAMGTFMGPYVLARLGVENTAVRGLSQGLTAHAFATAKLLEHNPVEAGFSALGMGLNAILTALWLPLAFAAFSTFTL